MTTSSPEPRQRAQPATAGLADTIARLRRALRRATRAADPANTLAVAQVELLSCVAEHPGIRPGQVAKLLNLRPNTVTTLVNALVEFGLIGRSATTQDGRAVSLSVTEQGRRAVHAWQATSNAVLNLAVSNLNSGQRSALARAVPALAALADAVDQLADSTDQTTAG